MDAIASAPAVQPEPLNRTRTVVITEGRTYGIEVRYGTSSQCVENLTLAVADDRTADLIGRTLDAFVNSGISDDEVRAEVFDALRYEFGNVAKLRPREVHLSYLADLNRAMDIFEPASTRERLAELGRHVAEMAGAR